MILFFIEAASADEEEAQCAKANHDGSAQEDGIVAAPTRIICFVAGDRGGFYTSHLREEGLGAVEPTHEAELAWDSEVNAIADKTLYPTCNSWYLGANVPGKPRVFMPLLGYPPYKQRCEEVAAQGPEGPGQARTEGGQARGQAPQHQPLSRAREMTRRQLRSPSVQAVAPEWRHDVRVGPQP